MILRRLLSRVVGLMPEKIQVQISRAHYYKLIKSLTIDHEPELKIIQSLVSPGDCVLDIGANFGVYSRFFAEWVTDTGEVISVEPIPRTYDALKNNMNKLGFYHVRTLRHAVSSKAGVVTMKVPYYQGGIDFYRARITDGADEDTKAWRSFEIRTVTIDELTKKCDRKITFMKMDVEGHELDALKGAGQMLRDHSPGLMLEIWSDPDTLGTDAAKIYQYLSEFGYSGYQAEDDSLVPRKAGEKVLNHFFLKD